MKNSEKFVEQTVNHKDPQPAGGPLADPKTSTENVPEGKLHQPGDLPDDGVVVRGGLCTADRFQKASGVVPEENTGKLAGVSVNSRGGASVLELSSTIRNSSVGTSTAGAIREAGGTIVPSPSTNNPYHSMIYDLTAEQLQNLFNNVIANPNK